MISSKNRYSKPLKLIGEVGLFDKAAPVANVRLSLSFLAAEGEIALAVLVDSRNRGAVRETLPHLHKEPDNKPNQCCNQQKSHYGNEYCREG